MEHPKLVRSAIAALARSYAPFSKHRVGAAIEAKGGAIYVGTNVENSSYGLTICAERAAVCAAILGGDQEFERVAIVTSRGRYTAPCGACRQVLAEFSPDMEVLLVSRKKVKKYRLSDLLPQTYRLLK